MSVPGPLISSAVSSTAPDEHFFGDEHAAAGRAPGDRDGPWSSISSSGSCGLRRGSHCPSIKPESSRTDTRSKRGVTQRIQSSVSCRPEGRSFNIASQPTRTCHSGIESGSIVTTLYDPMLVKSSSGYRVESGREWTLPAPRGRGHRAWCSDQSRGSAYLLEDPAVRAGALDTGLAERILSDFRDASVDDGLVAAAALSLMIEDEPRGPVVDSWSVPGGWRITGPAWSTRTVEFGSGERYDVRFRGRARSAEIAIGGAASKPASVILGTGTLVVSFGDERETYPHARVEARVSSDAARAGGAFGVVAPYAGSADRALGATDGKVRSPMPVSVVAVAAQRGERVEAGDVLVVVEAMKMEHTVVAPISGQIAEVRVAVGDRVGMDEEVVAIEQDGSDAGASEGGSTDDGKTPSERTASQ